MNNNRNLEEIMLEKRMIILTFAVALIIQITVLIIYFFRLGQILLAFPMVLAIFATIVGLVRLWRLGK